MCKYYTNKKRKNYQTRLERGLLLVESKSRGGIRGRGRKKKRRGMKREREREKEWKDWASAMDAIKGE